MATVDLVRGGTTGAPTRRGVQGVYVIDALVKFADALDKKGSALAAADVIEALAVPAGTQVIAAGAEVEEAASASAVTVDVGFADDSIVDGADATATGYAAAGTNGSLTPNVRKTSADTIDVKVATLTGTLNDGAVRVYAVVAPLAASPDVAQKLNTDYDFGGKS